MYYIYFIIVFSICTINEIESTQSFIQDLSYERNYLNSIINFIAVHALALTPSIFPIKYFAFIIVLCQYFYILKILYFKRLFLKNLKNFIINNPLIVIGTLGCLLISLSREDYNQSRYMTFSLCFQIGFLILFLKKTSWGSINILVKKKILVIIFLSIYLINLIMPNQGILFASSKNYIFENVKKCFELAKKISQIFRKKIIVKKSALKKGSTKIRIPDIRKIEKLGFKPKNSLNKGLKKIINI